MLRGPALPSSHPARRWSSGGDDDDDDDGGGGGGRSWRCSAVAARPAELTAAGEGGGRAAASPPALRMPGARTCSLAARRGLPWAVAAEALAEPPQGPEPRVPGWVGARSAGERGGGGHTGRDERRARGRAGPDRPVPVGRKG